MKKIKFKLLCTVLVFSLVFIMIGCKGKNSDDDPIRYKNTTRDEGPVEEKPVVYLYPEETMEITVELDYNGSLTCTYPAYDEGWTVIANPDGTLINQKDGKEYSYLFWEGTSNVQYDMSKGFVIKGKDTTEYSEG